MAEVSFLGRVVNELSFLRESLNQSIAINGGQSRTSELVSRTTKTTMSDLTAITSNTAAIITAAVLIGAATLSFWLKYGTAIAIAAKEASDAKRDAAEAKNKSTVLESRVNQQDTIIVEIRTRMAKLDLVDEIKASAKFIEEAVKNIVPRAEQEAKWQTMEQRFARLEADVREIKEHPHS